MNILVCIKQVPSSNKVGVDPVTGVMKRDGAESKMNPYDLFALEAALRLRESLGGSVTVMTMGPNQASQIVREAFAMGADRGYILSDRKFAGADVLATSYTLAQGIKRAGESGESGESGGFDIIFCGKQTTDGDTAQVGPEIGEWLGIPAIANVYEITETTEESITVVMNMGDSVETARIFYPCLVCVEKDIYMPRLPSYVRARATADRPIRVLTFADLDDADERHYGLAGSPTRVKRVFEPSANDDRECFFGTAEELTARAVAALEELRFI